MMLADLSSFLGTTWFIALVGILAYLGGSLFPIGALFSKIKKD